jgi:DNA polymerase III subunit epsilon
VSGRPTRSAFYSRGASHANAPQARSRWLDPAWAERPYLALDFETTGLDPARDRVVEVGALRFRSLGESARTYVEEGALASLVKPGIHIPAEVVAIHGIRDADVAFSGPFSDIAPLILALAEGATIVAHNAPFDLSFLKAELRRAGLPEAANPVLDSRLVAKAAFPGRPSYRLVDLAAFLGIDAGRSHRALDDARTCMELFLAAAKTLDGVTASVAATDVASAAAGRER